MYAELMEGRKYTLKPDFITLLYVNPRTIQQMFRYGRGNRYVAVKSTVADGSVHEYMSSEAHDFYNSHPLSHVVLASENGISAIHLNAHSEVEPRIQKEIFVRLYRKY